MEKELILAYFKSLSQVEQDSLLLQLTAIQSSQKDVQCQLLRREILDNKQGSCAHCGHSKYVKFGIDKGSQRYKCKGCGRSFTEYSGTWMAGIHKKDKIDSYVSLMLEEKSLDMIKEVIGINKKTAFDWRHKILSSIEESEKNEFTGITESDETFFLRSEKGKELDHRNPRKRGGRAMKRGVNSEHVAVIVTQDRANQLDLTLATTGRLKKIDLEKAIGQRVTSKTILCSDAHTSYKGFAIDKKIEHHPLRSDLKQRVKNGIYHIQHVNSTHHRLKKWIDEKFWGVSTKYLQNYLNWFRAKQILKGSANKILDFKRMSVQDIKANQRYARIQERYNNMINANLN